MKAIHLTAIFTFLLLASTIALAKQESLDSLKSRCNSASIQDQPRACADVAKFQLKAAQEFYRTGSSEAAKTAVDEIASFGSKAAEASIKSGKRLKDTEIDLRKIAEKLRDLKRNADFEDQPPIQTAIDQLEKLRNGLLSRMFGKGSK